MEKHKRHLRPGSAGEARVSRELYDLNFLVATTKASAFFLFLRLVVGFFGMDLYEVYWWFATGMAVSLVEISAVATRRARRVDEALRAT